MLAALKFDRVETVTIPRSVFTRRGRASKDFARLLYTSTLKGILDRTRPTRWKKSEWQRTGEKEPTLRMWEGRRRHTYKRTHTLFLSLFHSFSLSFSLNIAEEPFHQRLSRTKRSIGRLQDTVSAGYAMGNAIVSSSKGRWTQDTKTQGRYGGRGKRIGIIIKFSTARGAANIICESR